MINGTGFGNISPTSRTRGLSQTHPHPRCLGSGPLDHQHWGAMPLPAAVLSQLQNCPSLISTIVLAGGVARGPSPSWPISCARKGRSTNGRASSMHVCGGQGWGDAVGLTKCGKGVKILAIVDRHGLPLSVSTHAANHHEVILVQLSFYMLEAKPEHLIDDHAGLFLPGSNGSDACSFAGSTTRQTSSGLSISPVSPCSSNDLR